MTGKELKKLRNEYQWTAVKLAKWLGVNWVTVRRWEAAAEIPLYIERAITCLMLTEATPAPLPQLDKTRSIAEKFRDRDELTFQEAAEYLNISRRTLLDWKNKGRLPEGRDGTMHDGKQWRKVRLYPKSALDPLRRNNV